MPTLTVNAILAGETWKNNGSSWADAIGGAGNGALVGGNAYFSYIIYDPFSPIFVNTRPIMVFDISTLPADATIQSAVIKVLGYAAYRSNGLAGDPSSGMYPAAPGTDTTLVAGDYTSLGTTIWANNIAFSNWSGSLWNEFSLNTAGLAALEAARAGGRFRLGFRNVEHDVGATTPTYVTSFLCRPGVEYDSTNKPQLVITYTSPTVPTVTTLIADTITFTSARGRGLVTASGGTSCEGQFQWGVSTVYTSTSAWQSVTEGTIFSKSLTPLNQATFYHYRANARNSVGTSTGEDIQFWTLKALSGTVMCQII